MKPEKCEVRTGEEFTGWLRNLRDQDGRARILARLRRIELGDFGDHRSLGGRVSELKIDVGPGYRVYFTVHHRVVLVLAGGDKSTQRRDIEKARALLARLAFN